MPFSPRKSLNALFSSLLKNGTLWVYLVIALVPVILDLVWPRGLPPVQMSPGVFTFVPSLLYTAFALVGILGWRLNQSRILISSLLFLTTLYLSFHGTIFMAWGAKARELSQMYSMGLPISLLLILRLREARLNEVQSLSKLGIALAPMVLFLYWGLAVKNDFRLLAEWRMPGLSFLPEMPHFILVCVAVFVAGSGAISDKKIRPYLVTAVISMLPLLSVVRSYQIHPVRGYDPTLHNFIAFGIMAAIQLHAIFMMYWRRVYVDELTNIANRRALDEYLHKLNGEYAIAMIDIDHFKSFNDNYGHDEGDNVLRMVAQVLDEELKDKVYRYGGEEFCAVFEGVSGEDAFMFLNKVRRRLEERDFYIRSANSRRHPTSENQRGRNGRRRKTQITISIGLASPDSMRQKPEDVIILADQALYAAKEKGRNCVVVWQNEPEVEKGKKVKV